MLDLLVGFGHVLSVLLIAAGIAILIWNISVQAGAIGKHGTKKVAVSAPPQTPARENEGRVQLREPAARWH